MRVAWACGGVVPILLFLCGLGLASCFCVGWVEPLSKKRGYFGCVGISGVYLPLVLGHGLVVAECLVPGLGFEGSRRVALALGGSRPVLERVVLQYGHPQSMSMRPRAW